MLAVEPARLEFDVLDQVRPDWGDTIVAAEHGGILIVGDTSVQFRHELARQVVLDAVTGARRRRLHLELLRVLIDRGADAARIVHHAEAAGDRASSATFSLRAARQAAAASAHREAHSQYRRALRFVEQLPTQERARIHEEASREAYLNAAETEALDDALAALAGFEQVGDRLGTGRLHRWLSRLHWFGGRRAEADAAGRRAVEVLEPLGPSTELAWAYSNLSQLAMLGASNDEAKVWGSRAIALAERLGDDVVRAHALVNLAAAGLRNTPDDESPLLEAVAVADAAGEHHEATRGLVGLAYTLMENRRLERATEVGTRALTYADEHEVHALSHYLMAILARVDVLAGRWSQAEAPLRQVLAEGGLVARLLALSALALLQVRRGDDEAAATLALAWQHAIAADELQRLAPVAAAEAERAWLAGALRPDSPHLRSCYEQAKEHDPAVAGELARWLHEAGDLTSLPDWIAEPYRLELAGHWEAAAAAWAHRHMPYDQALCLARFTHGTAEALAIADHLGAAPLAAWIHRRLGGSDAT